MPRQFDTFDHAAILAIDFESAVAFFDRGAVERGIGYVGTGRVQFLSARPEHVRATCRGSDRDAYLVDVSWYRDEVTDEITSECTCPVEIDCKHGVAVFLEAQAVARAALGPAASGEVDGVSTSAAPLRGDWRCVLGDPEEPGSATRVPMALQFDVKQPKPTRWDPDPSPHLTARPLRLGASGKWVKSGATWSDVASGYHWDLRSANPDHLAVLRALRSTTNVGYYQPGADGDLNDLGSGMWTELSRAGTIGLAFVDGGHRPNVTLSDESARPRVSLTAVPHGVAIEVEFLIGDHEVPSGFH